jgi:hypothetical protein
MFVFILSIDGEKRVIQLVLSLPHPLPYCSFAFSSCYCAEKSHPPLFSSDRNECLLCARVIEDVLQRRCTVQTFKRTSIPREYNALDRKGGGCLRHCRFVNYHCTCKNDVPFGCGRSKNAQF